MDIALDEVLHFDAVTHHPSTAAVTDADSTPTWSIFEEDTDTPILSAQNFTKRTALTGNYRGSATLSTANGFEVGKWYNVIASATVNSIAGKAVVMRFRVVPAETLAGYPKVDQHALKGDAQSATDLKDFADDGYDPSTNKVQGVALVDTLTTYTGNTPQTADHTANIAAILVDTGTTLDGKLDVIDDFLDTEVAAIKAKTDNLPTDPADQSAVEAAITAATSPLATAANLATVAGYLDTEIAAILADTNELQTDWVNGGRLDLLIDAIKAKTDNLPAAPAATGDIPTVSQIWTTALTEAYRSTGATGTAAQLLYELLAGVLDHSISGTTKTSRKIDGTTAKTYTLDSSTAPTSITEAT